MYYTHLQKIILPSVFILLLCFSACGEGTETETAAFQQEVEMLDSLSSELDNTQHEIEDKVSDVEDAMKELDDILDDN